MNNYDPESIRCAAFFAQFSSAEQRQLMTWLAKLMFKGEVLVSEDHSLFNAFDSMLKYVGHKSDHLPLTHENG